MVPVNGSFEHRTSTNIWGGTQSQGGARLALRIAIHSIGLGTLTPVAQYFTQSLQVWMVVGFASKGFGSRCVMGGWR